MDDATVEKAWRTHWLAAARCGENGPISAHDIERSGFHAGYAAAIADFLADLEARGMKIGPATIPEPVAAWEAKAAEFHAANVAEERADPEYKRGDLRESARMLRGWLADAAPANELGQVSFLRALVEAHLAVVDEVIEDQDRAMIAASEGEG